MRTRELWIALVVGCAFSGCDCTAEHDCERNQTVCDGGFVMTCFVTSHGEPGVPWDYSETRVWRAEDECGDEQCVQGEETGAAFGWASCVLPEAAPECSDSGAWEMRCSGDGGATQCFFGAATGRWACGSCDDDAGCRGFIGDGCDAGSECAPSLECRIVGEIYSDGGEPPSTCTRACEADSDCQSQITGEWANFPDGGPGPAPIHGWPNSPEVHCVGNFCVERTTRL